MNDLCMNENVSSTTYNVWEWVFKNNLLGLDTLKNVILIKYKKFKGILSSNGNKLKKLQIGDKGIPEVVSAWRSPFVQITLTTWQIGRLLNYLLRTSPMDPMLAFLYVLFLIYFVIV